MYLICNNQQCINMATSQDDPTIDITQEDIDDLFSNIAPPITPSLNPASPVDPNAPTNTPTDDSFEIVDDFEAYWLNRGECPTCKNGNKPKCLPGGSFKCETCGWRI